MCAVGICHPLKPGSLSYTATRDDVSGSDLWRARVESVKFQMCKLVVLFQVVQGTPHPSRFV